VTPVLCNLCGVDDASVKFPAGAAQVNQIVVCNRCSLMYASPRAIEPDHVLIEQYDPDYVGPSPLADDPRHAKEILQVRDYIPTKAFLAARHPQRGRLLEIGSSFGFLLASFRDDGWNVVGVEPNAGLNRHAQKELNLDVISAILPDAHIESESMDAVLMMHVIEHVPDPVNTLEEIFRILKPGGTLVMETPIYDSLMFKLLGRRERSVSCEGHIYFFTSRTLAEVSERARFKVLRANRVGRSMNLSRLVYNVGVMSKSRAVQGALGKAARALRFDKLSFSLNVRDMERIYLGKPS